MKHWFIQWLNVSLTFLKALWQFFHCLYKFSRMPQPLIAVFGGKRVEKDSIYSQQAFELAHLCSQQNYSIIAGGGPGIMESANCGAIKNYTKNTINTIGIGLQGIDEEFINPCAQVVAINDLFFRKWLLIRYTSAFVIFPGGVGTVSEFFSLLDLIKLGKLKKSPIVLIGKEYWEPLTTWYFNHGIGSGYIPERCKDFFIVTNDIQQAFKIISKK